MKKLLIAACCLAMTTGCVSNRVEIAQELEGLQNEIEMLRSEDFIELYTPILDGYEREITEAQGYLEVDAVRLKYIELAAQADDELELYKLMYERIDRIQEFTGIKTTGGLYYELLETAVDKIEADMRKESNQ